MHGARAVHVQTTCTPPLVPKLSEGCKWHRVRIWAETYTITYPINLTMITPLCGFRPQGVHGARARGRKTVLTRDPPVQGNVELATPKLAHGWNLTSATRCCPQNCVGVQDARAMHAQPICTPSVHCRVWSVLLAIWMDQ